MTCNKHLKRQIKYFNDLKKYHAETWLIDYDYLIQERLEEKLLMKKLKETNIDSPVGVTDVVEIMLDKPMDELTDKELIELTKATNKSRKKKEEKQYEYVYQLLERHRSVFVSEKTYKNLDEKRLGNYTLEPVKKVIPDGNAGYIIWKI